MPIFYLVSCIPGPRSTVTGKYHGGVFLIHPGNDKNKRGAFLCTVGVGGGGVHLIVGEVVELGIWHMGPFHERGGK